MRRLFALISFFLFFTIRISLSQYEISGIVTDSISGGPIANAKAELYGLEKVTFSDQKGRFTFALSESGLYTILITAEDFASFVSSLSLSPDQPKKELHISLSSFESHTDTIDVHAKLFKKADDISTSYTNTLYEEIRKNPGSFEDVIKYFATSPGVNTANDSYNELLVRGGSSIENLVLVDGFEIPNANHYGPPGTTGGALSYINSKLVNEVDFFSGGFPARYGDRLSSVMDIKYREGNNLKHIRDINISATGFGGFFEGPITRKGSYMFSIRKSYFELLEDQLNSPLLPDYWDFNLKLNYNLSGSDKISLTGMYVLDHAYPYKNSGEFANDTVHMNLSNTSVKYEKILPELVFTSVTGYSEVSYDVKYILYRLKVFDRFVSSRQTLSFKVSDFLKFDINAGLKYYFSDYYVFHSDTFNESGYYVPELSVNTAVKTYKISSGINATTALFGGKLILNTGVRLDYFQYMRNGLSLSPRLGIVYKAGENTRLTANAGIYFQAPELAWLVNYPENRELKSIKLGALVLGAEHFIGSNIKLTLETYLKQYYNYPVSIYDPNYIFINNGVDLYPNFLDEAVSAGKGYSLGADLSIEKKSSGDGIFWSLSYSYSHSKFLALAGDYQPLEFDPGNQVNITAGIKFKNGFSVSSHFKYAGGRPYTPYDLETSHRLERGVFIRNLYNKARLPEYVRLDLRVEQSFRLWNVESQVYLEVLNLLDRENIYGYSWDFIYNMLNVNYHFLRLPILGLSVKF